MSARGKPSLRARNLVKRLLRTYHDYMRYVPSGLMPFGTSARPWAAVEDARRVLIRYVAALGTAVDVDTTNALFAEFREEGTDLTAIEQKLLALLARLERSQGAITPAPF